jgi:hypothetical protein
MAYSAPLATSTLGIEVEIGANLHTRWEAPGSDWQWK